MVSARGVAHHQVKHRARLAGALALACTFLSACAMQAPPPTLTFENVQRVNQANIPPLALGEFTRGPAVSEAHDRSLSIRAVSVSLPSGTLTAYLRDTVQAELAGSGKLAPDSAYVLSGQLTRSEVSTGGAHSEGVVAARFHLTHNGQPVFDKELAVQEEWPSAFLGEIAINDALNHYTALYPKLFGVLIADPYFRAALR